LFGKQLQHKETPGTQLVNCAGKEPAESFTDPVTP